MARRTRRDLDRDAVELGDELRAFLALMIPNAAHILSVRHERGKVHIGYIDATGVHEIVTWAPVSWQEVE